MLKVLVAPLDWGLGHATRCIPIIKELINQGCTVIIAAGGAQKTILQEEFPDLAFVGLPGFRLKYGKNRAFTLLKIILALPKILIAIKRENAWLRRFAGREGLDLVISDNRYGLHGAGVFSVFITHQLAIRSSFGAAADWLLQAVNYAYIRRFSVCWVPDREEADNLAGSLSHPRKMPPVPVRYIGWLSRLEVVKTELAYDLAIVLSGPEPQRTILERLLWPQLDGMAEPTAGGTVKPTAGGTAEPTPGRVAVVRGLAGDRTITAPGQVDVFDYLPAQELERVICQSRVVLARSGYSTVMDLVRLGKKAIYIPTPGQPEQEYLGPYLDERGWGICRKQHGFVLTEALQSAKTLKSRQPVPPNEVLKEEINRILIQSRRAALNRR